MKRRADGVVMPKSAILGRKNCTHCTRWRHIHEFGHERRRGRVYIKSVCLVCEYKRRRKWYADKTVEERQALNREHYIRYVQPILEANQRNRRVDAWPVRQYLIQQTNNGRTVEQIAFRLNIAPDHIKELVQGYREYDCELRPIRTVSQELMAYIAKRMFDDDPGR
jgi:hypothetical protein